MMIGSNIVWLMTFDMSFFTTSIFTVLPMFVLLQFSFRIKVHDITDTLLVGGWLKLYYRYIIMKLYYRYIIGWFKFLL